ncbi:hypothetical protein F5Y18DRAFT_387525 [Xylariaceae sp. FL1019]|nr:hypothetical protein F5Y18DRAFT_387525 [Xylariaceae sp. FL1019]
MGAMDVDVDEPQLSSRLALYRYARAPDDDISRSIPERVHRLWLLITSASHTRLHGVEESILRWLLKQMAGNDETAEHVRRYPLTWSILSHVFSRIPAQSLGRSLAYLRFVSLLNKTLGDVTTSQPQPNGVSAKRKRRDPLPETLDELKSPEGCLKTASEVFKALAILLEQGNAHLGSLTAEKRVGAEHIKSLFSSSRDDTRDIATKLLVLCGRSLDVTEAGVIEDPSSWVTTLASLWGLRLHSKGDSIEFAQHPFGPASSLLDKLKYGSLPYMASNCRDTWIRQLERFLSTYFIRPARQQFAVDETLAPLETALPGENVTASVAAIWSIAAKVPWDSGQAKSKTEHAVWAEKIFEMVLETLQPLQVQRQNQVLGPLLDIALETTSLPNHKTLHKLYQTHAIISDETDWTMVSKIIACDPDVFLLDQSSETIFQRISKSSFESPEVINQVITDVIIPLLDAFGTARDLAGFVKQWFQALCSCASSEAVSSSIWFSSRIRAHLASVLRTAISTSMQLSRLLEILDSSNSQAGELVVILDGICAGLNDECLIAETKSKIFSMALEDQTYENVTPDVLASRWRVAGHLASWGTSDDCKRLWKVLKSDLKPTLKRCPSADVGAVEAFACCYQLCLSNHIGGKYEDDLMEIIASVAKRLLKSLKAEKELVFQPFLDIIFSDLPRLVEQAPETSPLLQHIADILWRVSQLPSMQDTSQLVSLARSLIQNYDVVDNESLCDALMARFLDAFDDEQNSSGWTQPRSLTNLLILLAFPTETWTRGRRKRFMGSWKKQQSKIASHAANDSTFEMTVYRLLVKVMQQPTFYENMKFADLVFICSDMTTRNDVSLALVDRLIESTIKQILSNVNEATQPYLQSACDYVKELKSQKQPATDAQVILLKNLVIALNRYEASHAILARIGTDGTEFSQLLAKMIEMVLGDSALQKQNVPATPLDDVSYHSLSVALDAAQAASAAGSSIKFQLKDKKYAKLQTISSTLILRDADLGWKLLAFLVRNDAERQTLESFCALLDQGNHAIDEELIYDLVDAFVGQKSQRDRDQLLRWLVESDHLVSSGIGRLLAAKRLLELRINTARNKKNEIQGTMDIDTAEDESVEDLDLAKIHCRIVALLAQAPSLSHFREITNTTLLLLDRHGHAMSQLNIEATLSSVVEVCSVSGPNIQGPNSAGEIFANLFKLVALIIKRHRLRLSGHFPILLTTLRTLLNVLLADPSTPASKRASRGSAQFRHPPWLHTRLQPRHGERFARLLTLICEPSAASVARSSARSELDSARDVAKRAAGQYMYLVLEVYVKLQLEVEVSKEMRKALEVGVYSMLDITSEGRKRVINESLDASGRAIFRALFAEYRKFGEWKGV